MTKPVYYNDNAPFVARWLRNLISAGLLPAGDVDDRSITEVKPDDLKGYDQCHFFAGVGGWPYALNLAGWPVDRPVWTGSCPCQPLSSAGQHEGHADERHLWPAFFGLIAERRPVCVFGEQVASKDGREWLSGVRADLETLGYACGAAGLPAAGVAAPHVRSRLYWVADAEGGRWAQKHADLSGSQERSGKSRLAQERPANRRTGDDGRPAPPGRLADSRRGGAEHQRHDVAGAPGQVASEIPQRQRVRDDFGDGRPNRGLGDTAGAGLEGRGRPEQHSGQRVSAAASDVGGPGAWSEYEWVWCRDGYYRRVNPSILLLDNGIPARMGKLRGLGNAVVPQVAAVFIQAFMESDY